MRLITELGAGEDLYAYARVSLGVRVCACVSVCACALCIQAYLPLCPHLSLPQVHVTKFKVLVFFFFKDDFTSVIFCEHIWCFFKA